MTLIDLKATFNKAINKEVRWTVISQFISLFSPLFLVFYITLEYGKIELVRFEALLSICAFFSIIQDYGVSTFYSYVKPNAWQFAKIVGSLTFMKLIISFFLFLINTAIWLLINVDNEVYYFSSMILFLTVIDHPYVFFSNNKTHLYSLIMAAKYPVCILLIYLAIPPLESILYASIFVLILASSYILSSCNYNISISMRLVTYTLKKFKIYTVTEAFTGIFSQLDGFIASELMPKEQAFVYVFLRKFIRAGNVLLNYVYRIAFSRKMKGEESSAFLSYFLITLNAFGGVFFVLISWVLINYYPVVINYQESDYYYIVLLQASILIFGCLKVLIRNNYLYSSKSFNLHFTATVISAVFFLLPVFFYYFDYIVLTAVVLSLFRVLSDIIYIVYIFFVFKFRKWSF